MIAPHAFIVCGSHRAREKALRQIGERQGYYISLCAPNIRHRGIYPVNADELAACLQIKGIRKLADKRRSDLQPCWSYMPPLA